MTVFLKRLTGYLLLSTALAAALGPFSGEVRDGYTTISAGWFPAVRYLLASFALLAGLKAMRGTYRPGPGIQLNPGWSTRFGDTIFTLFLSFCAYCSLELVFQLLFDMVPFLDDEAVLAVSSLGFLPASLVCAFFTTMQYGQSVEIGVDGVRIHVPGASDFAGWESVRGFELRDSYSVGGGSEKLYAKKFQTKLVIKTMQGGMALVEAGQKRIKRRILEEFRRYAPERLQQDLDEIEAVW